MEPTDKKGISRRQVVGGMLGGVAASMTLPGVAQAAVPPAGSSSGQAVPLAVKKNPIDQYPKPPFERQPQEPPGLASKMQPRPDHGENSYGRAAAIAYAREGADVAINYLPVEEPDAREVIDLIRAEGRNAVAIPGDLRDEAFCKRLVSEAVEKLGGLDILVNNAGHQQTVDSILDLTSEQFDTTFKTNVYAMFWLTKAAMPHLQPGAAIINTASVQAFKPGEALLDYASTKAAIVAFTKSLAKQVAQKGIRVNAVAPGPYWTPLQPSGGQTQEKLTQFGSDTPYGRPGQPVEIAPLYVLFASQEASYSSGQVWCSDGGNGTV